MKKLWIPILAFTLVIAGCKKEVEPINPVSTKSNYAIKEYYAPEGVNVKNKVLELIETSEIINPNNASRDLFGDMEVNEAMWLLEASNNYLENDNMDDLDDGETVSFTLSAPIFDDNGIMKISGQEMTDLFNDALIQIAAAEQIEVQDTKFIDYQITAINTNTIDFNIQVVMGVPIPLGTGISAWPSGNTDLVTAAQVLEDSINKYLINYNLTNFGYSFLSNVNIVLGTGQYPRSSTVLGNLFASDPLVYNCNDCLFYSNHLFAVSTDLPDIHFDYFFNNGLTLINNMRNILRPYASSSITVSCKYKASNITSVGIHTIEKVYIGTANAI